MEDNSVTVSSVRSRFENGSAASGKNDDSEKTDRPKLTPRTKKPSVAKKDSFQVPPPNNNEEPPSGPKRATLVREIQSLPKNSVMKRLQMFENDDEQDSATKKASPTPPLLAAKPTFLKSVINDVKTDDVKKSDKAAVNKPAIKNDENKPMVPVVRKLSGADSSTKGEGSDEKVEVRSKTKRPPRPPPSYRKSSGSEDDTPTNSPRDSNIKPDKPAKAQIEPIPEVPKLAKEKPKQPSRPPPPCTARKNSSNDENSPPSRPFSVTLLSKTSTQITFADKKENDKVESVASLANMFEAEKSPKPPKRAKPKFDTQISNEEKIESPSKDSKRVSVKPDLPAGKPKIDANFKPKLESETSSDFVTKGDISVIPVSEAKLKGPPKKPPPPKPPRTFAHDAYLESKRREEELPPPLPQYDVYDDRYHDYEPVQMSKSPKTGNRFSTYSTCNPTPPPVPPKMAPLCGLDSIRCDHDYESLPYGVNSSVLDNYQYVADGSYRSYASYASYASVGSGSSTLKRSASDEVLYAKPSTLRLHEHLPPLYAVPDKRPPVPPKRLVGDGGYALPYDRNHFGEPAPLQRSRSFRDLKSTQNQTFLGGRFEDLRRNLDPRRGVEKRPYRKDGRFMNIKTVVYNEVRNKVDEIYSQLSYRELEPSEHAHDRDSDDSDSQIDLGELQRRIQHASAVREKNRSVYEKIRLFKDRLYPSLFQYALIVGLRQEAEGTECVPHIKFSFPQFVSLDEAPIPDFCFPDKSMWTPRTHYDSETFSFVLTRQDGSRDYGYCRRLLPRDQDGPRLPVVVCIVSPLGAHQLYTQVLDEVEKRLHVSQDQAEELIQSVYSKPLPSPGRAVQIKSMNSKGIGEVLSFIRASDMRLENVNLDSLFNCLSIDNVIKVFSSILLERRILLSASKLSTLTNCIHALASLLYPLQWEHTFIPVLPQTILEMTCSPTPYIIGVLSVHVKQIDDLPTEEILIVDLDADRLHSPFDDETSIVPRKLQKALSAVVKMALEETDTASHRHLLLSEAFLRLFVEAIGHYGEHIVTQPDGSKQFVPDPFTNNGGVAIFAFVHTKKKKKKKKKNNKKETFCKCVSSKSLRMFLEWLTETHLFQIFIMEQLEADRNTLSLFETRIMEHRENLASMPVNAWSNFRSWAKKMGKAIKTNIKGPGDLKKK